MANTVMVPTVRLPPQNTDGPYQWSNAARSRCTIATREEVLMRVEEEFVCESVLSHAHHQEIRMLYEVR